MRLTFLFLMLLISSNAYAGISVCDDGSGKVSQFSLRGDRIQGCHYYDPGQNITNTEALQLYDLLKTVPQQHLKLVGGVPVEMSQAEKTAVDDAMAQAQTTAIRTDAKNQLTGFGGTTLYQRAFADVLKDEINILRAQHGLAPRTLTQLKTAIQNRVDSGQVDN